MCFFIKTLAAPQQRCLFLLHKVAECLGGHQETKAGSLLLPPMLVCDSSRGSPEPCQEVQVYLPPRSRPRTCLTPLPALVPSFFSLSSSLPLSQWNLFLNFSLFLPFFPFSGGMCLGLGHPWLLGQKPQGVPSGPTPCILEPPAPYLW